MVALAVNSIDNSNLIHQCDCLLELASSHRITVSLCCLIVRLTIQFGILKKHLYKFGREGELSEGLPIYFLHDIVFALLYTIDYLIESATTLKLLLLQA